MEETKTAQRMDRMSKKTPRADMEQRRTTGFLLGLTFVLALLYVTLEWNSRPSESSFSPIDIDELVHESELVPMSNVETQAMPEEQSKAEKAEELRVVDDDVELQQPEEVTEPDTGEGSDEQLLKELEDKLDDSDKALAAMGVDPENPLNFHVVEDLPQFPGGAVEFMKWLTKNLKYPPSAQQRKVQGRVLAQFTVNKDGSITDLELVEKLDPQCDREALRVLRMMPKWKAGIQDAKPCRTRVCIPIVFKL